MRVSRALLLLPGPVPAFACESCRPAVFALGLSPAYLADLAWLAMPLLLTVAGIFLSRWDDADEQRAD